MPRKSIGVLILISSEGWRVRGSRPKKSSVSWLSIQPNWRKINSVGSSFFIKENPNWLSLNINCSTKWEIEFNGTPSFAILNSESESSPNHSFMKSNWSNKTPLWLPINGKALNVLSDHTSNWKDSVRVLFSSWPPSIASLNNSHNCFICFCFFGGYFMFYYLNKEEDRWITCPLWV